MSDGACTESAIGLAPLYRARDFDGSFTEYVDALYWQYRAMTEHAGLELWGRPLCGVGEREADGRDAQFWHMITDGRGPGRPRQLNLLRCAVLPRAWDVLQRLAEGDVRVIWWLESRQRLVVAPVDFDLLIILRRGATSFRLLTVHPVDVYGRPSQWVRARKSWNSGRSRRDAFAHPVWRTVRETWRAPVRGWRPELGEYA